MTRTPYVDDVLCAMDAGDTEKVRTYLIAVGVDIRVLARLPLRQERLAQRARYEARIDCCIRDEQLKDSGVLPDERIRILTEEFADRVTSNVCEYIGRGVSYSAERKEARVRTGRTKS